MIESIGPVFAGLFQLIAMLVISIGLLQNLIYLVQLALAAAALIERPPSPEPGLLWRR